MKAGFQRSVRSPVLYPVRKLGHAVGWITATALASMSLAGSVAAEVLDTKTRVLFERHCLNCHSTAKHKGDLDLEQVLQPGAESTDPKVWQQVLEQVSVGEMPPKDQPVMDAKAREQLMVGVRGCSIDGPGKMPETPDRWCCGVWRMRSTPTRSAI